MLSDRTHARDRASALLMRRAMVLALLVVLAAEPEITPSDDSSDDPVAGTMQGVFQGTGLAVGCAAIGLIYGIKEGFSKPDGLLVTSALSAVAASLGFLLFVPWLAAEGHAAAGGRGTREASFLGAAIGMTLAGAGVATGLALLSSGLRELGAAAIIVPLPLPWIGVVLGLEASHKAQARYWY